MLFATMLFAAANIILFTNSASENSWQESTNYESNTGASKKLGFIFAEFCNNVSDATLVFCKYCVQHKHNIRKLSQMWIRVSLKLPGPICLFVACFVCTIIKYNLTSCNPKG